MKKIKLIVFITLFVLFLIVLFFSIFGTSLSYTKVENIKKNRILNENLIDNFKINNLDTIFDKTTNTYYYTISDKYENHNYILKIELKEGYKYKILNNNLNIIKVNYKIPIDIIIYNDKYYYETKIQLTNLPLVNIESKEKITIDDNKSVFKYINQNNINKLVENNIKIHTRGNTAAFFEKKSYKLEMYNENYTKEKNIAISNFYYGSDFILDAVYRDPSKIRNILSIDLWNSISNDFNNININSEFVELFINNEYEGLYVLTEPINRKSLKLNKSSDEDTSVIIKSTNWLTFDSSMKIDNYYDNVNLGYEIKYPNKEKFYEDIWKSFYSLTKKYYDKEKELTFEIISGCFDINNYIDIIIYNAFINNGDNNFKKNNYFYLKNLYGKEKKIYIQPWDMEYSFGLSLNSKSDKLILKNMEDYNVIQTSFDHPNDLEINKLLIARYWELRKTILTKEYFDNKLNEYKNELSKGVALRDSEKWYEYNIEKEIEDIRIWIYNRLDYFDNYVESLKSYES